MRLRTPNPDRAARRPPRDERGLTTLEWLLIVAAIAGLAALAVVLVTKVVGDTAEQVGSLSPRLAAARLQAHDIEVEASQLPLSDFPSRAAYNEIRRKYKRKCEQLGILYRDIEGFHVKFIYPPAPRWRAERDRAGYEYDLRMNVEIGWKQGFGGDPPVAGCWMAIDGKQFTTCCKVDNPALRNALRTRCHADGPPGDCVGPPP
jgi:hypothetical protein